MMGALERQRGLFAFSYHRSESQQQASESPHHELGEGNAADAHHVTLGVTQALQQLSHNSSLFLS